ncbi:unnamed protein product [Rhizophagus irregularis]|nr:unnamed protein product [Rhizophagus irregularis]
MSTLTYDSLKKCVIHNGCRLKNYPMHFSFYNIENGQFCKTRSAKTPLLISTTIKHYLNGPPKPSWNLKNHLAMIMLKSMLESTESQTIEEMQIGSARPVPVLAGMMANEIKINNKYRYEAQAHLEKILKPYEHVLDTEWKDLKEDGIISEWVQVS